MDFKSYFERPFQEYATNISFLLAGFLYGFNSSILPGIESTRKVLGYKKITFYIFTWDLDGNAEILDVIKSEAIKFPDIELRTKVISLEEIDIVDIWNKIYYELELKLHKEPVNIDIFTYKRLLPMLAMQQGYEFINYAVTHNNDVYDWLDQPVIRIKPNVVFHPEEYIQKNFISTLQHDLNNTLKTYCNIEFRDDITPFDVFFSDPPVTSNSIGDRHWISTSDAGLRLFGYSKEDTVERFKVFLKTYLGVYPKEVKNSHQFALFSKNPQHLPLEGSAIMKKFADLSPQKLNYASSLGIDTLIYQHFPIKNPWYRIVDSKIETWTKLELYPIDRYGVTILSNS